MISGKNSIQDNKIQNLEKTIDDLWFKFDSFITNHFNTFQESNAKEHSELKAQISEFKGQIKWIAPLLLAILSGIITVYFK